VTEKLVSNPFAQFEDKADPSVPSATLQIYQGINDSLGRPKEDVNVNRASSATMCSKRRWYQRRGVQGTPLTPRKLINFLFGDLAEKTILYFVRQFCVGDGKLYSEVDFGEKTGEFSFDGKTIEIYKQKLLTTKIDGIDITCHADGFGKRNSDGQWEVVECKSSANWGFKSFQADGPEDYLKQAHTIMASEECKALNIKETRYFYLRKETGHLWDRLEEFNQSIWEKAKQEFIMVNKDEESPAPFPLVEEMEGRKPNRKPTGRMIAEFPCSYCPFLEHCHGKFSVEWKDEQWGNKKPTFVFSQSSQEVA